MMMHETDLSAAAGEIADVPAHDPYHEDYRASLHALERATRMVAGTQAGMAAGTTPAGNETTAAGALWNRVGDHWFNRLRETLEIEIRSYPLRRKLEVAESEVIMIDSVNAILDESGDEMVAVNTGMYHAQRQRFMGTRQESLGEYLSRNPQQTEGSRGRSGLYSIAFFGMRGERIRHSRDQEPQPVPPMDELPRRNLSRPIADAAGAAASVSGGEVPAVFLPLDPPAFERRMPVSDGYSPVRAAPTRQFDAFVVHPRVSVLRSLRAPWYTAP